MISKNYLRWIQKQLPDLIERELISSYQAESILFYYQHEFKDHKYKFLKLLWGFAIAIIGLVMLILIFCR